MKKSNKFVLLGASGIVAIAAVWVASTFIFDSSQSYQKKALSFLQDPSAKDAQLWLEARYFDIETGEKITPQKLLAIDKAIKNLPTNKAVSLTWKEEGPDNIGGRTRAILVDKTNINRIWAGSVSGGLFVSTNRADTWEKVESYPGSKFISSMTQMANGTIFVATGSLNEGWNGDGLWYSQDFGATWSLVPQTGNITKITEVVCANNSNKIWFSASSSSTNGLQSWTFGDASLVSYTSETTTGNSSAVQISPDGQVIVAAVGSNKTFVSKDGGTVFMDKSGSANVPTGSPRIEYAISQTLNSSGKRSIYALRTSSNLMGINVSHDNGDTWSQIVGPSGSPSNLDIFRNQGTYNSVISVKPADPEFFYVGGIDIHSWKQTSNNPPAGGFNQLSQWFVSPTSPTYVHADNHEMKWDNTNRFYLGNDGGIGITTDFGTSFYPANRGYNVTQFYGIAFDRSGSVMGGAQDNGTLYNDHSLSTYKEFREVGGGDGFECEISFFNPNVMFMSSQFGAISRSDNRGGSSGIYIPDYPASYAGLGTGGGAFPFHTEFALAEYYDENSEDSVTFLPSKNYAANSTIRVSSRSTGDSMEFVTPVALYFDDTVHYSPGLTETRTSVVNAINGQNVLLDNYTWSHIGTSSGNNPPLVNDSLLVEFPTGDDTVVVQSVGSYLFYFAQNPDNNKILEIGLDSVAYNIPWDTIRLQDPFQSWFVVFVAVPLGSNAYRTELWGTRNALRFAAIDQQWVLLASGLGGNEYSNIDIEFSKNLNHLFISTGSSVRRISGLGSVYTSDPDFATKVGYHGTGIPPSTPPTATTATTIYTGSVEGIAINPSDANDILIFPGNGAPRRATNATTASTLSTTALSALSNPSPFIYDGIIDRDDSDILVLGTHAGVFVSDDGGASWTYSSAGFEGTPVYEVRQSWRTFEEGNGRPGEIYIGTYGRGIWSSATLLGLEAEKEKSAASLNPKMKAFPNPAGNSTTLNFKLAQAGNTQIAIYSTSGELKKTIQLSNMAKGEHDVEIDLSNFSNGIYIVKMISGKQSGSTKVIKM